MESPLNYTSTNFEKAALSKLRSLVNCLPQNSKISREPWGRSTILCIDFADCPHLFSFTPEQMQLLTEAIRELGLANSVIFRIGSKIMGWKNLKQ